MNGCQTIHMFYHISYSLSIIWEFRYIGELARRSGCVMDCHATFRGSIPVGDDVKTELHVLRKGQ